MVGRRAAGSLGVHHQAGLGRQVPQEAVLGGRDALQAQTGVRLPSVCPAAWERD